MTDYKKIDDNRWIVNVQEDGKTKELYLTLPPEALAQVGWDIGDNLIWEEMPGGAWSIKKKEKDES